MNSKILIPIDFQGTDSEKKVYAALIKLNKGKTENLKVFPYQKIEKMTELSKTTIWKCLTKLKNDGLIEVSSTTPTELNNNKIEEENEPQVNQQVNPQVNPQEVNNLLERLDKCAVVMKDALARLSKLEEENVNLKSQVTELSNKVLLFDAKLNAPKKLGDELVELWNGCERENTLIDSYERLQALVNGNDLSEKQKISSLKVLEKYKDKYQNLKWEIRATEVFNDLKETEFPKMEDMCSRYPEGKTTDEENEELKDDYYGLQDIKVRFKFSKQQMNEILRIEELLYKTLFD